MQQTQTQLIDEDSMDNVIDEIVRLNKSHRFALELNSTTDEIRKNDLKEIIKVLDGTSKMNFEVSGKSQLTKIWENMDSHTLHGKWTKLSVPQKKDRMKNFLTENVKDQEKRKSAETILCKLIDTGKLKKNAVSYDQEDGKIMSLNVQEYDDLMAENSEEESDGSDESDGSSDSDSE